MSDAPKLDDKRVYTWSVIIEKSIDIQEGESPFTKFQFAGTYQSTIDYLDHHYPEPLYAKISTLDDNGRDWTSWRSDGCWENPLDYWYDAQF